MSPDSGNGSSKLTASVADALFDGLSNHGWLSQQPRDFRQRIGKLGRWVAVPRGQRLYSAGDEPTEMYGVGEGMLDLAIPILGGEECTLHRARIGFWIGDGALPPDSPRTLSVEAATDCQLFRISFVDLRAHLSANPADWEYMHRLATANGILAVRILGEVLSLPPTARVARLLLRLSTQDGTVKSTHEDLGRLAGMSRATFRRSLAGLIASGALQTHYGALKIIDRSVVEVAAETYEV